MFEPHCRDVAPRAGARTLRFRSGVTIGVIAASAWLGSPRSARAAGFAAARFGGEHGNVTTTNPTALYFNPAGIAFSKGFHVYVDGTLALRSASWEHPVASPSEMADPPDAAGANTGRATLFNVFGGPMLGATMNLGNLAFGASLSVPFGGRAHWDKNNAFAGSPTYPLAVDGVQRWHGIDGELTFIYLTAGAAYRMGPLAIGVTGNLVLSSVKALQAKNPIGMGVPDTTREGRADLDVSGTHGSFALGAMLEALPERLWIGASYQAQPGLGPMTLTGKMIISYNPTPTSGTMPWDVNFNQALPDVIRLGARFRPNNGIELRVSGDYTRWSVMKTQCVAAQGYECAVSATGADASGTNGAVLQNLRRYWKDTIAIRGGVSYWLKPTVEIFAGLGFETAAVPDETLDPGLPDADTIAPALGARVEIVPRIYLAGSYTHIQYLTRDITGTSDLTNAEIPTKRADGSGRYTGWIGTVNANVEMQF
jgi:long-chain fatty acid transport protein